jgi:ankyrin repeat protein
MEVPKHTESAYLTRQSADATFLPANAKSDSTLSQRLKDLDLLGTTLSDGSLEHIRALFCDDPPTVIKTHAGFEIKSTFPCSDITMLSLAQEFQDSHMPRRAVDLLAAAAGSPLYSLEQRLSFLQMCAKIVKGGFQPSPATATLLAIHSVVLVQYGGFGEAAVNVLMPLLTELDAEAENKVLEASQQVVGQCIAEASTANDMMLGKGKAAQQLEDTLISAIKAGHTASAETLLAVLKGFAGGDPDGPAKKVLDGLVAIYIKGIPLFHIACRTCGGAVVEQLVALGANIALPTQKGGQTPLHFACGWGKGEAIEVLIKKNVDLNVKDEFGQTPLHLACQGSEDAHVDVVKLLVANKAAVNVPNNNGASPLHSACRQGSRDMVSTLLNGGASANAQTTELKLTPLHIACQDGNLGVAQVLIESKAEVACKTSKGVTPLHLAAEGGHGGMIDLLLNCGADVDEKTGEGATALHLACQRGKFDAAIRLIDKRADINSKTPKLNITPLHLAAASGNADMVRVLLDRGAEIRETNEGATPLYMACQEGRSEVAQLLVEKTPKHVNKGTNVDTTPLFCAIQQGNIPLATLLLQHGAEFNRPLSLITPMHVPVVVAQAQLTSDVTIPLMKRQAQLQKGDTLFHFACRAGHLGMVELLIREKADINKSDANGYTPLHIAAEEGNLELAKLLIARAKADVSCVTPGGQSPLHLACKGGNFDLVSLLYKQGASFGLRDFEGKSPGDIAFLAGHQELIKRINETYAPVTKND